MCRFFSTIAGSSKETSLVMSGGEGYVDFRVGELFSRISLYRLPPVIICLTTA